MKKRNKIIQVFSLILTVTTMFICGCSVHASATEVHEKSFFVTVSDELNTRFNYIYISVQNTETLSVYEFPIYRQNKWCGTFSLPDGEYKIVSGGIENDWQGNFPISRPSFTVNESTENDTVMVSCGKMTTTNTDVYHETDEYGEIIDTPGTQTNVQNESSGQYNQSQYQSQTQVPSTAAGEPLTKSITRLSFYLIPIILFAVLALYMRKRRGDTLE